MWGAIESWARNTIDAAITVWKDVKQWKFLENWNAAWQQAGSEAFDAMQSGTDQWFAKNLANVVTKAWAWWVQVYQWVKSGDGKAIQEWAQNLSETISAKPIAKLSWLLLPENSKTQKFLEWAAGWLDIYGNVIGKSWSAVEKFKKWDIAWGVIDTWFAALGALPFTRMATAIGASAIWWGLNASWASEFISKEKWVGKEKLTNQLVSWWVDPVEAQRYAENTIEGIDLAAQALAMRYGMRVGNKIEVAGMKWVNPESLTMMDVIRHNAKNAAISGGIQTAPAAIYSIIDSANNPDGVKESAKALISNAFASAIPMPVSMKWKTGEQMKIPVDDFMQTRGKIIENNYQKILDTKKIDGKKATKQEIEYANYVKQQKEWETVPAALPKETIESNQDYTVNRDQPQIVTPADRRKYIEDNAERFLESGKWPNGKKLTKPEKAVLQKFIAAKKVAQKEWSTTTAWENPWVVYQEPLALPAPEKFTPTTIPTRDFVQEAKDRVIAQKAEEAKAKQAEIDKQARMESLYGELPAEAMNQVPVTTETAPNLSETLTEGPVKTTPENVDFVEDTPTNSIHSSIKQNSAQPTWLRVKTWTSRFLPNVYNLGYALNNIIVKLANWKEVEGGSYIKSQRNGVKKWVSEWIINDSWITPDQSNIVHGSSDVENMPLIDLIVKDVMTDSSSTITPETVADYRKSIEFTRQKAESMGLDWDAAVRRHLYKLTEGNQELRDKYFSPEEQAQLNALFAQAYAVPRNNQPTLEADGFIGKPNENYEHAVTDYNRIPEEYRNTKVDIGGKVVEFRSESEARAFLDMEKQAGRLTDEQYKKAQVWILKHRNDARLNAYRSFDPVLQLHSYADDVGRMYANREVLNTLNNWKQDGNIGKEMESYFTLDSNDVAKRKDIRMTLMDIYDVPQTWYDKTIQTIDNAATWLKLIGIWQNLAQGTFFSSTTALWKSLSRALTSWDIRQLKTAAPVFDTNKIRILESEWFVPKSEYLWDIQSEAFKKAIDVGTAQIIENPFRATAAIGLMKKELWRAWIDTKWLKNDTQIMQKWEEYTRTWKPENVALSRANIHSDLDSFGDASNMGRYDAPYVWRLSKKFKSFFATTVGRVVWDTKNILDAARYMKWGNMNSDSATRLITLWASVFATYQWAVAGYQAMWDTKEIAKEKAKDFLTWSYGWMMSYFKDPVWNAVSVPTLSVVLGFWTDLMNATSVSDNSQKAALVANAFRKNIWPLRDINNWLKVWGIDVMQWLSDTLDTSNPEYTTGGGTARGYNAGTWLTALAEVFGLRWDKSTERILLDKVNAVEKPTWDASIPWKIIDSVMRYKDDIAKNNMIWSNIKTLMDNKSEDIMKARDQAQYTYWVLKTLRDSKTEREFYQKNGIPDSYIPIVRAELYKMAELQFKNNRTTEEAINTTTFADTTLTPNYTNIDSSKYFQLTPDQKRKFWDNHGWVGNQMLNLESTNLGEFNRLASKYIFKAPSEYSLTTSAVPEWKNTIDLIKETEQSDPRLYNDFISFIWNWKSAMDRRVEKWWTPLPMLESTGRDRTKKNIRSGNISVDPTQIMNQNEYADLLERSPTLKWFLTEVKQWWWETDQTRWYGQFATPQDDAVISNFNKTQALTTYVSTQFWRVVNNLKKTLENTGNTSTEKLDISEARRRLVELDGVIGFMKENQLNTAPFRDSIQSALANSYQIWDKLKDVDIKNSLPHLYEALLKGLAIRGEKNIVQDIVIRNSDQQTQNNTKWTSWQQTLSKMLSTPVSPIQIPEWWILPDNKKKVKPKDLKDTYYKVPTAPQKKVVSLSEMLKR